MHRHMPQPHAIATCTCPCHRHTPHATAPCPMPPPHAPCHALDPRRLGFRIGEDTSPSGECYVHSSVVERIEALDPGACACACPGSPGSPGMCMCIEALEPGALRHLTCVPYVCIFCACRPSRGRAPMDHTARSAAMREPCALCEPVCTCDHACSHPSAWQSRCGIRARSATLSRSNSARRSSWKEPRAVGRSSSSTPLWSRRTSRCRGQHRRGEGRRGPGKFVQGGARTPGHSC